MHCRCLLLEFWDILEQEMTQTQTSVWWVTEPFKEKSFHFVICLAFFSIQSFKKAVIGKPLSESQGILNSPPLPPPPFPTLTNWMYQSIWSFKISPSSSTIPPPPLPAIPWGIWNLRIGLLTLLTPMSETRQYFSLQFQYNIKQTRDKNKEKY